MKTKNVFIKSFPIFTLPFLLFISVFSQNQHNFWYFGRHAGMDFSGGTPVAVAGKSYTHEGTSGISDVAGNLLFYIGTDTVDPTAYDIYNVYDATHTYMFNGAGLWGNTSTSQGPVIIPKPGTCNQYLIFHVEGSTGGCQQVCSFFYSEVDMTLNGGLGAVTSKNNLIYATTSPSVTEKITATPHANGIDYWVVIHEVGTSNFRAYLITAAGVGGAVISTVAPNHPAGSGPITGYMKFNTAGTKLAVGGASAFYLWAPLIFPFWVAENNF